MALPRVHHGSARSLSWLCKESVMALRKVCQVWIWPAEAEASLHRGRIPPRAMTDCSQSQDRLLLEPRRTPQSPTSASKDTTSALKLKQKKYSQNVDEKCTRISQNIHKSLLNGMLKMHKKWEPKRSKHYVRFKWLLYGPIVLQWTLGFQKGFMFDVQCLCFVSYVMWLQCNV